MRKLKMIFKLLFCHNCVIIYWDSKLIKYDSIKDVTCGDVLYLSECLKGLVESEAALMEVEKILYVKNNE